MIFKSKQEKRNNTEDNIRMTGDLQETLKILQKLLTYCPDITIKDMKLSSGKSCAVIFVNQLNDTDLVQRDLLEHLYNLSAAELQKQWNNGFPHILSSGKVNTIEKLVDDILDGNTIVLLDGTEEALSLMLRKYDKRNIEEPEAEKVLKGSHEGFTEVLATNLAVLRRRAKTTTLKFREYRVGKRSNQLVILAYIEDLADPELVEKMDERLKSIEYDYLPGIGYIEQMTSDRKLSPFPQYQMTERPDKVIANLMEGRLAVILDGTPVALLAPVNFFQFFQAMDDYTTNWVFGTFLRLLRFIAVLVAVYFPALYIAILSFNYQAVPLYLLIPLAESRSRVPFPPIFEALMMEVAFELIREASTRLPPSLGPTIGIVGGLVIGQTAIEAGIVSNIMVIVVGITAITTFIVPTFDMSLLLRLARFMAMVFAAVFGIVGVIVFAMIILAHIVTLESLGQPYFQPVAPFKFNNLKDMFIRVPFMLMSKRPDVANPQDKTRGRGYVRREKKK